MNKIVLVLIVAGLAYATGAGAWLVNNPAVLGIFLVAFLATVGMGTRGPK